MKGESPVQAAWQENGEPYWAQSSMIPRTAPVSPESVSTTASAIRPTDAKLSVVRSGSWVWRVQALRNNKPGRKNAVAQMLPISSTRPSKNGTAFATSHAAVIAEVVKRAQPETKANFSVEKQHLLFFSMKRWTRFCETWSKELEQLILVLFNENVFAFFAFR